MANFARFSIFSCETRANMKMFDPEYGVPTGLKYLFLSMCCYLKCRPYGTQAVDKPPLFIEGMLQIGCDTKYTGQFW